MEDLVELDKYWLRNFGELPPIAHVLRESLVSRWVRFHTLPESKRYPETDSEMECVFERYKTVIAEVTTSVQQLGLLTTNWYPTKELRNSGSILPVHHAAAMLWRSVAIDDDPDPVIWDIYHSTMRLEDPALNMILRMVAEDRIYNVMILDSSSSWLVHPYDGGMDVFAASGDARNDLASRYAAWLSKRPDWL